MKDVPIKGEEYNAFDDGKISKSRLYKVKVKSVIPFKDVADGILDEWESVVKECHWLYAKTTDYIIVTNRGYYSRTLDGGWFSFNGQIGCDGRLDVDGELYTRMESYYE